MRQGSPERGRRHTRDGYNVAPVRLAGEPVELGPIEEDHDKDLEREEETIEKGPRDPADPQVVPEANEEEDHPDRHRLRRPSSQRYV